MPNLISRRRDRSASRLAVALGLISLLSAAAAASQPVPVAPAQMQRGSAIFHEICFACHQLNGRGIAGVFPPLAHSDLLLQHRERVVNVLLHGLQGPVKVNGRSFDNAMPVLNLSDRQIADVLTYALNSWGNHGGVVTEASVHRQRLHLPGAAQPKRTGPVPGAGSGTRAGHGLMNDGSR